MPSRRQVLVVAVLVGLLVVLFVVGVTVGATGRDGSNALADWRDRLSGADTAKQVAAADLTASGGCVLDRTSSRLLLTGPCRLTVPAVGRFSLHPSRRLTLLAGTAGVSFRYAVEDQTLRDVVEARSSATLSFGRSATDIMLQCVSSGPCVVDLPAH